MKLPDNIFVSTLLPIDAGGAKGVAHSIGWGGKFSISKELYKAITGEEYNEVIPMRTDGENEPPHVSYGVRISNSDPIIKVP
jgi:hypothetical protein